MEINKIYNGDALETLKSFEDESVDCVITSPPYFGLRDYGVEGQIGLEETPEAYVDKLVQVFREVRRVLADDGTLWLNLGDSYSAGGRGDGAEGAKQKTNKGTRIGAVHDVWKVKGYKPKNLLGIPWRVAFALQADGWYLRQDIIWAKPNPMPESVTDRCTKAHEYIFLLSKSPSYYYDNEAIKEPAIHVGRVVKATGGESKNAMAGFGSDTKVGFTTHDKLVGTHRNRRSVWTITTKPFKGAHFATFPQDLVEPMIKAGCPEGGTVLDPFFGAGTTGVVAQKLGRNYVGIELNPAYVEIAEKRLFELQPSLL